MARAAVWKTRADCDRVWEVLSDGWTFPGWVVGAARVRAVDADWPAPGTRIHHSVGLWPGLLHDSTEVVRSVPRSELVLHARAWPFGVAEILLRLTERDGGCEIEMREHAVTPPWKWLPDLVQDWSVYPRNRECLRRLSLIAEHATDPAAGTAGEV